MKAVLCLGVLALAMTGCASGMTRNGTGVIYTEAKDAVTIGNSNNASKVGESCASNVLALVSTGDMSIDAAKKAGNITHVSTVDYSQYSVLGVYSKTCTIVHGD